MFCVTERVEASLGATSGDGGSATFCTGRRLCRTCSDFFGAAGVEAEETGAFLAPVRVVAPAAGKALLAGEILESTLSCAVLRRFLVALLGGLDAMTFSGSEPDSSNLRGGCCGRGSSSTSRRGRRGVRNRCGHGVKSCHWVSSGQPDSHRTQAASASV